MGGSHSRHDDAFTNDLQTALNDTNDRGQNNDNNCFSCLLSFCPPPKGGRGSHSPTLSSRHSSRHGLSRNNSADPLGTPVPDTPEPVRRMRDAAMERYYNNNGGNYGEGDSWNDEKKVNSGGSFGRADGNGGKDAAVSMSSRYGGLEKEESGMFSYEHRQQQRGGGNGLSNGVANGRMKQPSADLHDGPDAETELYQKYELCEVLGVGSTSTCHRCVELSTGTSRACKIVDKLDIDPKYQNMMDQFYTEIKTLRSLQHPNIIQLYDVYITEDKIYIIMELMVGGELFDYVVQKGTLTEEEASRIVRMVTSALVYMHSKNVVHRDLKPENLLLAHKPRSSHDIEVKIIDFGLSKVRLLLIWQIGEHMMFMCVFGPFS